LRKQLLTNRIIETNLHQDIQPHNINNEEDDGDSSNFEELEIDEAEIPIVTK
jgi:hypothetical protein